MAQHATQSVDFDASGEFVLLPSLSPAGGAPVCESPLEALPCVAAEAERLMRAPATV
jgi:hypothetical protein